LVENLARPREVLFVHEDLAGPHAARGRVGDPTAKFVFCAIAWIPSLRNSARMISASGSDPTTCSTASSAMRLRYS
jgi:hypothetical protein